jgi:hypothetical protein
MPRGPRSIVNTLNSVTAMKSVIEGPGAGERAITLAKLSCSGVNAQVAMAVMSKAVTTPTPTAMVTRKASGAGRPSCWRARILGAGALGLGGGAWTVSFAVFARSLIKMVNSWLRPLAGS